MGERVLDDVDRALIHALRIDGRAPFSRIAAVCGVSPQTIARRYNRLRLEASLRVVGLLDPVSAGRTQWLVRLTATPRGAQDLARALVRRTDTSWVKLTSGGTEITAIIDTDTRSDGHSLLLQDIPRTSGITGVSAHCLLHTYLGGPRGWPRSADILDVDQQDQLRSGVLADGGEDAGGIGQVGVSDADRDLLAVLQHDGRAGHAELAAATGRSLASTARRLADLRAAGALAFDVEIDTTMLGAATQALLWMSVAPAQLDAVARRLAEHSELAHVAATTGPTNLVATALCRDPADLHHFLTRRLGALSRIRSLETAPVLRTLKASGPIAATGRTSSRRSADG